MHYTRRHWYALGLVLLLALLPSSWLHAQSRPVVIGSKMFPESQLLAQMLAIMCTDRGIPVELKINLGGTLVAFDALRTGAVDVYPEYTGTGLNEILKEESKGGPEEVLARVRDGFASRWHLVWLDPFGFEDTYALAMRLEEADLLHVKTLSDLSGVAAKLTFGSSHEFLNRQDGYPGLQRVYGLHFGDVRAMQHSLAYQALMEKKTDVTDVYTTDGKLDPSSTRVLADDKHFFPPYYGAPVVRQEALNRIPALREALNALAGRISDETMQRLNHQVESEHREFKTVAIDFLRSQGLTKHEAVTTVAGSDQGLLPFLWMRRAETMRLAGQHMYLVGIAMSMAVLVGIPLGILITRYPPMAGPTMGFTGVLQTIPSIALLAFMIPYLGLGAKPAVAALFLYALLPIVRNTFAGIRGVDPALIEVGTGMGLRRWQILKLIELPLAMSVIMAGIRTAAVICIGTATLAAFIGAGGLGDPIVTGLTLVNVNMILSGAIPAAVLALVVDLLLGTVERYVVPRGLRN